MLTVIISCFVFLFCFRQIPERVSDTAMSRFSSAQMYSPSTICLFQLALSKPATSATSQKTRRNIQLQFRCLLHQIWRDNWLLSRGWQVHCMLFKNLFLNKT